MQVKQRSMTPRLLHLSLFLLLLLPGLSLAGSKGHSGNRLMELLTAGIVAKVLQKQEDHHGGGGGHDYYPVPIPLPMQQHVKHHHVTEKIIPIPVPHHTTRIIHINAGSHHGGANHGSGFGHEGGGDDHHHDDVGHSHDLDEHGLGSGSGGGSSNHYSSDDRHHHHAPTIQQLLFHDNGLYGPPPRPPPPHPHGVHMRRPMIGVVQGRYPMAPMPGMMPYGHPSTMHPVAAAMRPVAAGAMYPATAAAHQQMVRVRHYYALPSARQRVIAYPQQAQLQQQQLLMLQQQRYPRPW